MFEKWYRLTGITKELFEQWKDELRTDILWWRDDTGDVEMRIRLTGLKAAQMKHQINEYNKHQTGCVLGLERI